jgi:SAM-dependent methyltransferase
MRTIATQVLRGPRTARLRAKLARWRASWRYLGKLVANVGSGQDCPLCGWHFRRFLPTGVKSPAYAEFGIVGGGYRQNAICPRCWSSDRERHLFLFLRDHTPLFHDPLRVLHIAPELNLSRLLRGRDNLDYLSGDISSPRAMVRLDVTRLGLPDGSFDVVLCNHVLEHIPDDRQAMSELFRVLSPGGWAVLQVPYAPALAETIEDPAVTTPEDRERIYGQHDHVRLYGRDYLDRLERTGFRVALRRWEGDGRSRHALLQDEEIIFCTRG